MKNKFNLKKFSQHKNIDNESLSDKTMTDPMDMENDPMNMENLENDMEQDEQEDKDIIDTPEDSLNFQDGKDLQDWLEQRDSIDVRNELLIYISNSNTQEKIDSLIDNYYQSDLDSNEKLQIAVYLFEMLPDNLRAFDPADEGRIMAPYVESTANKTNEIIKKIAKKIVSNNKKIKKSNNKFNLKKFAQHKNIDNVMMWGPDENRIDPFYRMPVSDYHIFERNKGWGQNFGDRWDIDYEVVWRKYIMDKYSRPYKDDDGNWVGGYINKRFEVDRNIPETNNYQLKPGEKRKPRLMQYGLPESRMQDAREKDGIKEEEKVAHSKSFNLKQINIKKKSSIKDLFNKKKLYKELEAIKAIEKEIREFVEQNEGEPLPTDLLKKKNKLNEYRKKSGLATYAQIKPLKELNFPDEPSPKKPKIICKMCGGQMKSPDSEKDEVTDNICPSCGAVNSGVDVGFNDNGPSEKGKQYNPFSNKDDMYVNQNDNLNSSSKYNYKLSKKKKEDNYKEDVYKEEFYQCIDPEENNNLKNDDDIDEIEKSCIDLAIDN